MEQRNLPNVTLAIVLSIIGYVCCCFYGLPAIILGVIAYILLRQDYKKYLEQPELYSNYNQWKTARILAIVAIVIGVLFLMFIAVRIYQMGGIEAAMEQSREMMEQWGIEE